MCIWLVELHVVPTTGTDEHGRSGGAFILAYMNRRTREDAHDDALALIHANGWTPTDDKPITVRAIQDPASFNEYAEQATTDGEVLCVHSYPPDCE